MAQQGIQLDQDEFCCSICLNLLNAPVTIPCGHSYCMGCIKGYWDEEDQKGLVSCPQCRDTFNPRPALKKSNMLAEVVERLRKTGLQDVDPPDHCHAGPRDVACDFCTGRNMKAVKTCLQCLASYCDIHLQPHYQYPALKKHKLVKVSTRFQEENICPRHDEVRKVFCRTDQQCICYLCCMEEHKGHDMISAAAERKERQKELDGHQQNIQQRIQETEKVVKVLHQEVESINLSADRAVKDSDTIFTELITSIEIKQEEVRENIRDQQKCEVSRTEELKKRVEQEVTELRRRQAELEQLSHTEDHVHFLQNYTSLSKISDSKHTVSGNVRPLGYFEDVTVAVSNMRDVLEKDAKNISELVNRVDTLLSTPPEPKTRAEFLRYFYQITLDPNTAHQCLSLSKGNRKVTLMDKQQSYPHHPQRFIERRQILSGEGLTGRYYWEAKWRGDNVAITLSYKDISRTGSCKESGFGLNHKSWSLRCSKGACFFKHRDIETKIPGPLSSKVGVYLDHTAGTLSFYSISDTMTLLLRVQTTFTQILYPGFGFDGCNGGTAELCNLK